MQALKRFPMITALVIVAIFCAINVAMGQPAFDWLSGLGMAGAIGMTTLTEGQHRGEFIVGESCCRASRENVTVLSGQNLDAGEVLGRITRALAAAPIPAVVGTGNGLMSAVRPGPAVQTGDYVITCTATAANGGTFSVVAPDGTALPDATVGTAYKSDHIDFLISDGATDFAEDDVFTLAVTAGGTPAVVGTGNGTIGTISMGRETQLGTYRVECTKISDVKGATATPAANAGNTGNGTLAAATVGASAKPGVYRVTCIEPATDLGKFTVEDPDGIEIGVATVGTEFSTGSHLTFTIADGGTDFVAGDGFTITVASSGAGGEWRVTTPTGETLPVAKTGTAYTSEQINFTVADGSTDYIVGDYFHVVVANGSGKVKAWSPTAVDGSEDAYGVLFDNVDASSADTAGVAIVRLAEVNADELQYGAAITAAQKAVALAQLAKLGIVAR